MSATKSLLCPKCRAALYAPRRGATVICPECWHAWDWAPSDAAGGSFWRRNAGRLVWAAVIAAVLGGRWWWAGQSRALADARAQLDQADSARRSGDLAAAERRVSEAGEAVGRASPLFPTLGGVRAVLRERLAEQTRQLAEAVSQKHAWAALVSKFKAADAALDDADTTAAARRLDDLRAERERLPQRETVTSLQAEKEDADSAAARLIAKIDTVKSQTRTLADVKKQLADARTALTDGHLATTDTLLAALDDDLGRAAGWNAVPKIGKERDWLVAAANSVRDDRKAAYHKKLGDTLSATQTKLAAKEFDEAKKLLTDAQAALGTGDVVLAEALKQVGLAAGKEEWTAEDDRRLAKMPEEANEWTKVRRTDTRAAYQRYLRDNPKGAFAAAAEGRLVDLEVAEQKKGKFSPLPDVRPDRFDPLLKSSLTTVKNDTPYTLTVLYSGTESKRVVLTAGRSETVSMAAGYYTISASVSAPNVVPFIGSRTVDRGDVMTESFYIKNQTRPDPFGSLPGGRLPRLTDPFR